MIHEENLLIGKAFLDAYEIEQKAAVYPRIILHDKVVNIAKAHKASPYPVEGMYKEDRDGLYMLDPIGMGIFHRTGFDKVHFFSSYRFMINQMINDEENGGRLDIRAKGLWYKKYYNEVVETVLEREGFEEVTLIS